jgi:hypothetical protein
VTADTAAFSRPVAGSSAGTVLVIHNDGRLWIGTVPLAVVPLSGRRKLRDMSMSVR